LLFIYIMVNNSIMQKITSVDNEKIKFLRKLGEKKNRDESGQFLVENLIIIHNAIQAGFLPISLFISEDLIAKNDEKLKDIIKKFPEYFLINEKINKYFSSLSTPSGIAAVFEKIEKPLDLNKNVIYLNAINDPGNLGTILRTAVAFDLKNIVVDEKCADIYNSKTISAAKDAIFKLNIAKDNQQKIFKQIKNEMKVYATSLGGEENGGNIFPKEKFCLVLGNEANGVEKDILEKADKLVRIKMSQNIESLNVAVAAGILFKEIYS
jgi:RNA methyltransferase, TrmH family